MEVDKINPARNGGVFPYGLNIRLHLWHPADMRGKLLTEEDFIQAASDLGVEVAVVKAVADVESAGNGFLSDGRVKVLFEGHQFHARTSGKWSAEYPTISYPKWTRAHYARGRTADIRGDGELRRLEQASKLNRRAALMSASYGKFQIMGFNFALCGFDTVDTFYEAMGQNEGEHLKAFISYIKEVGLDDELRERAWARFARRYNGPGYRKNSYDKKLADAYAKYSGVRSKPRKMALPAIARESLPLPIVEALPTPQPDLNIEPQAIASDSLESVVSSAPTLLQRAKKFLLPGAVGGGGLFAGWESLSGLLFHREVLIACFVLVIIGALAVVIWLLWKKLRTLEVALSAKDKGAK